MGLFLRVVPETTLAGRNGAGCAVPCQSARKVCTPIHSQHRMDQQPGCPALADGTEAWPRLPRPQHELRSVLYGDDMPAGDPRRSPLPGMPRHLGSRHCAIVQQSPELHLRRPLAAEPANAATRRGNQRRVQLDPPFSRRPSPNRPNPNSKPAIDLSISPSNRHRIETNRNAQQRCVNAIACSRAGGGGCQVVGAQPFLWLTQRTVGNMEVAGFPKRG